MKQYLEIIITSLLAIGSASILGATPLFYTGFEGSEGYSIGDAAGKPNIIQSQGYIRQEGTGANPAEAPEGEQFLASGKNYDGNNTVVLRTAPEASPITEDFHLSIWLAWQGMNWTGSTDFNGKVILASSGSQFHGAIFGFQGDPLTKEVYATVSDTSRNPIIISSNPLTEGEFYRYEVDVDMTNGQYSVEVYDSLQNLIGSSSDISFTSDALKNNGFDRITFTSYKDVYAVFADNITVTAIPEVSYFGVGLLGVILSTLYLRRRR